MGSLIHLDHGTHFCVQSKYLVEGVVSDYPLADNNVRTISK